MAATLQMVQPMSCGVGGDCFATFYDATKREVRCMDGSGRSPALLSRDRFLSGIKDGKLKPECKGLQATVPGAVKAWFEIIRHFGSGKLDMADLFECAILYGEKGFPVGKWCANEWALRQSKLQSMHGGSTFLDRDGLVPTHGAVWRNVPLAGLLRRIAADGIGAFYEGPVAQGIVNAVTSAGGIMSLADLQSHINSAEPQVLPPVSTAYRKTTVHTTPLPSQGAILLEALNILEGYDISTSLDLPNPSTIPESGWVDNMKLWPALQEHHITYYLLKTKACDLEEVQALKSLESYNYVVSGKVGQLLIHQYSEHACIIKGDVTPSQSENNAPHKPWVCIGTDCRVLTGACSCMVGKTRVCSHVGYKLKPSEFYHLMIEALRLAFVDGLSYVADPEYGSTDIMISKEHARQRRAFIDLQRAMTSSAPEGLPSLYQTGTVVANAVDTQGNACCLIGSTGIPFGCTVVSEYGFPVHARGAAFNTLPGHPNCVGPRKKPYHTLMPVVITDSSSGRLLAVMGSQGGSMTPQALLQVILSIVDLGLDPQEAVSKLRIKIGSLKLATHPDDPLTAEEGMDPMLIESLESRGQRFRYDLSGAAGPSMGYVSVITTDECGNGRKKEPNRDQPTCSVLWCGTDPRCDGSAIAY